MMKRFQSRAIRPLTVALVCACAVATNSVAGLAQVAPDVPVSAVGDPGLQATVQSRLAYRLHQGDEITVTVFGEPTLTPTTPLRVVQGGSVAVPLVGNVNVGGLTTADASTTIANALRKYVRDPKVTVAVYSVGPVEALVLGNVKVPGKYTLPPPARLTDVLAAAGGLGPTDGDLPDARLESPAGTTSNVSLQALLHDGNESLNQPIESGETVYIPSPNVFAVQVTGAVDKPGDVLMHDGDDVAVAVARAGTGGGQVSPDLNKVTVTHTAPDGTRTVTLVNLYPILQRGDVSHDVRVQKGDLVYVPISPRHVNLGDFLFNLRNIVPYPNI